MVCSIEQPLYVDADIGEFIQRMDVPSTMDRSDDVLGQEEANHIANVVGAHAKLEVLKPGASLNGRWLHGKEKCLDDRLAVAEAHPAIEVPVDLWHMAPWGRGMQQLVELVLATKTEVGQPIDATPASVLVEAAKQVVDGKLPEKMAARVARHISPLG